MTIERAFSAEFQKPYKVEVNGKYLDFQSIEETKHDETKPWKPALEVTVVTKNGKKIEGLNANTPFFTFEDTYGNKMTVSAAAADHIDKIHIKGEDEGSKFDESSLKTLFENASAKMPEGIAREKGVSAFDIEMGKSMGKEGIATLEELKGMGYLTDKDITGAEAIKLEVKDLNKEGSIEEKNTFIEKYRTDYPDSKIQFQLVRGSVLVPVVDAPKHDTTRLFMVFGPDANGDKTLYTVAPGRNMPRHPNPDQHRNVEGVFDEKTFNESAEAWFETAMLKE